MRLEEAVESFDSLVRCAELSCCAVNCWIGEVEYFFSEDGNMCCECIMFMYTYVVVSSIVP